MTARCAHLRHRAPCTWTTPVWFAPFSPNGVGNKLMSMVMALHFSLLAGRQLVASDWPPSTLKTTYKYHELFRPSACQARISTSPLLLLCRSSGATWPASTHYRIVQALFDKDTDRPPVTKCSVISCYPELTLLIP